jgi:hypothetical protein
VVRKVFMASKIGAAVKAARFAFSDAVESFRIMSVIQKQLAHCAYGTYRSAYLATGLATMYPPELLM